MVPSCAVANPAYGSWRSACIKTGNGGKPQAQLISIEGMSRGAITE